MHRCRAVWLQAVITPWCSQERRHKICSYKWTCSSTDFVISTCGQFLKAPTLASRFVPCFPLIFLKNRHPLSCAQARTVPLCLCVCEACVPTATHSEQQLEPSATLELTPDFPAVLMVGMGLILVQASPLVLMMLSRQLGVVSHSWGMISHSWLPEATRAAGDGDIRDQVSVKPAG